jgi:serine-type D-Ala-D-Ala carboxypeptidase
MRTRLGIRWTIIGIAVAMVTTAAGPPPASPTANDARYSLDGRLVVDLVPGGQAKGTFLAPAGRAGLVLDTTLGTVVVVTVNGIPLPMAAAHAALASRQEISLDPYLWRGANTIDITTVHGSGRAVVPFATLTSGRADDVGLDAPALAGIDEAINAHIGPNPDSVFPGAVVLVAKDGVVVKHTAYGSAQTYAGAQRLPTPRPMRPDTIFDLASISKVVATTAALMKLVDQGRVNLDDKVSRWLGSDFTGAGKSEITVRHLLAHCSGVWQWQPTYLWATNGREAIRYVTGLPLRFPVCDARYYSDLGFMLLGQVVQRETGRALNDYVRDEIHGPLGMSDTGFRPAERYPAERFAATSTGNPYERNMISTGVPYPILGNRDVDDFTGWRRHTLRGEVNDGNSAYAFGGVAGHAGVFATARDVAVYGQTLINGGGYGTRRLFAEDTVTEFTRDQFHRGQGLGFWTHRFQEIPGLDDGGIGHSGFTGTQFAMDPQRGLVIVMLTNRNHPNLPYDTVTPVWNAVLTAVGKALIGHG